MILPFDVLFTDPCDGNTIDVAIVGGGVSGVYSAYKLSENYDWNIHIFEAQDRIGGRTFSVDMPGISDFKADIGAMRFKKSQHPRLVQLAKELELTVQTFTSPSADESLYYFRGQLIDKYDMAAGNLPYHMTDKEKELSPDITAMWRFVYSLHIVMNNLKKYLDQTWRFMYILIVIVISRQILTT